MTPPRVDLWGMKHSLMRDLPWATPEAIGRLTLHDLACLGSSRPAGVGSGTAEGFHEYLRRRAAEEANWHSSSPS